MSTCAHCVPPCSAVHHPVGAVWHSWSLGVYLTLWLPGQDGPSIYGPECGQAENVCVQRVGGTAAMTGWRMRFEQRWREPAVKEPRRRARTTEHGDVQSLTLSAHFVLNTCGRLIVSAETGRKPLRWRVLLFFYLIKNNRMHRPHITCTPLTIKQRQSWKMCERSCLKDGCRLWYTKYPPNETTGVWEKV